MNETITINRARAEAWLHGDDVDATPVSKALADDIRAQMTGDTEDNAMQIERHPVVPVKFSEFIRQHGLILEIHEQTPMYTQFASNRYYARIKGADIKEGCCLIGVSGNGNTEDEAVSNYVSRISEQTLIIDAFKPTRREIIVPVLVFDGLPREE